MADTGGPSQEPGLEARVARLESDVAHIRTDVAEVKSTLNRLAPIIDEMRGFLSAKLPDLATKAELVGLGSGTKAELADLHSETKEDFAEIRRRFADLRSENKAEFADVRREMAELRLDVMQRPTRRQAIFDVLAIVGLIGAVLTIASQFAH
jgi:chromosome segregation ATPase